MAKANRKAIIIVRHMAQIETLGDNTFWGVEAGLDRAKETFYASAKLISTFLAQNELKLIKMESSGLIRSRQTAEGLAHQLKKMGFDCPFSYPLHKDHELNPMIEAWEMLNKHFPASVRAIYAPGSEAKGLLIAESYRIVEHLKNSLKKLNTEEADIIVTHSPIIEAAVSALLNKWSEAPISLKKGEAVALIFDEKNNFVKYEGIYLAQGGP